MTPTTPRWGLIPSTNRYLPINQNSKQTLHINSNLAKIFRILKSIMKDYFNIDLNYISEVAKLMVKIRVMWSKNGLLFTIRYLKSARLYATRYLAGQPLINKDNLLVKVSLTKDYFPKIFLGIKPLLESSKRWDVVIGFTILTISRCLRRGPRDELDIDLASINTPSKAQGKILNHHILVKVIKSLKIPQLRIRDLNDKDYHIFSSAGPDGPSTKTSLITMCNYTVSLFTSLCHLTGDNGIKYLIKNYLRAHRDENQLFEGSFQPYNIGVIEEDYLPQTSRKLEVVEDPEMKARVVAIFDHFSQTILDKISKDIYDILRNIPSDRTFTQSPYFDHEGYENNSDRYHSIDLSSATDRFPIDLQTQILDIIYDDKNIGYHWAKVMTGEVFRTPSNYYKGWFIRYVVGQPMGARSSWPIFTLSHHILVRYAAWLCGYKDFNNYIILGDDIVIHNDKVAKSYNSLIKWLGVDVSTAKTHSSFFLYEFAKRWIWKDRGEVSPLPIKGIVENISNLQVIYQIFRELVITRNLFQVNGTFTDTFCRWYSELSKQGFDKEYISRWGNPFKGFKPQVMKTIRERIQPVKYLLDLRDASLSNESLRNLLAYFLKDGTGLTNLYGETDEEGSFIPLSPSYSDNLKLLYRALNKSINKMAKDAIEKAYNLASELSESKDWFGDDLLYDPTISGLMSRALVIKETISSNPYLGWDKYAYESEQKAIGTEFINKIINNLFAWDESITSNREGSSPTLKKRNISRFAVHITKNIKGLVRDGDIFNDFTPLFDDFDLSISDIDMRKIEKLTNLTKVVDLKVTTEPVNSQIYECLTNTEDEDDWFGV